MILLRSRLPTCQGTWITALTASYVSSSAVLTVIKFSARIHEDIFVPVELTVQCPTGGEGGLKSLRDRAIDVMPVLLQLSRTLENIVSKPGLVIMVVAPRVVQARTLQRAIYLLSQFRFACRRVEMAFPFSRLPDSPGCNLQVV